jgi:hypothetical protein
MDKKMTPARMIAAIAAISACCLVPYLALRHHVLGIDDPYYHKFTRPAPSWVFGSSEIRYGIDPALLDSALGPLGYAGPIDNLGLTQVLAAYGPASCGFLRDKTAQSPAPQGKRLFLLGITLDLFLRDGPTPRTQFPEARYPVYQVRLRNASPNWEYLLRNPEGEGDFISQLRAFRQKYYLNADSTLPFPPYYFTETENGWRQSRMPERLHERMFRQTQKRVGKDSASRIDPERLAHFRALAEWLRPQGQVVLLSMPVHDFATAGAEAEWKALQDSVRAWAEPRGIPYFDHSGLYESFKPYDGIHMDVPTATRYSRYLAQTLFSWLTQPRTAPAMPE